MPQDPVPSSTGLKITICSDSINDCQQPACRAMINTHHRPTTGDDHSRTTDRSVSGAAVFLGGGPAGSVPASQRDSRKIWPSLRCALARTRPLWTPAPAWPTSLA
jgi:hypothetical protein